MYILRKKFTITLLIFSAFAYLVSCGSETDDGIIDEPDNNDKNETLLEKEIMSMIDDNVSTIAKYTNEDYNFILTCYTKSTLGKVLTNASISYGLEYGLNVNNQWYVELKEDNGIIKPLSILTILTDPENSSYDDSYTYYLLHYNILIKLRDKAKSGQTLSNDEKSLYRAIVKKYETIETYMKQHIKARTYVCVNGVRYYYSTLAINGSNVEVKKVPCYSENDPRVTTSVCDFCTGDGICSASHCDGGLCSVCDGSGHTYVSLFGSQVKQRCDYCEHGKCASCHGSMKCNKCNGTGSITKTEGGIAKNRGAIVDVDKNNDDADTSSYILYDNVKGTYWKSVSFVKTNLDGESLAYGTYDDDFVIGFGFGDNLIDCSKSPRLIQALVAQGIPLEAIHPNLLLAGMYEGYISTGDQCRIFPLQTREGMLGGNFMTGFEILSITEDELILSIKQQDEIGIITFKKETKESFMSRIKTSLYV